MWRAGRKACQGLVVTNSFMPTLEDLRNVADAAWLWDGARGRIVWANAAGIAYFGGTSMFDLIDRPFDFAEPGVERVMMFSKSLKRGQSETALMHFPSSGNSLPIPCTCTIHALGDGRSGVLVVAPVAKLKAPEVPAQKLSQAFDLLPFAAAFVEQDGSLHGFNAAASLLLLAGQKTNLGELLESASVADDLLARLATVNTVSEVKKLRSKIGVRDFRLTLRRLGDAVGDVGFAMLLLDDITERRALEHTLQAHPPEAEDAPRLGKTDAEAFQYLGQVLNKSAGVDEQSLPPAPVTPHRKAVSIPAVVVKALDSIKDPVIITKSGLLIYANAKAQKLLGFGSLEDLINDNAVWNYFTTLEKSTPAATLLLTNDRRVNFSATMAMVAWQSGPARQFKLQEIQSVESKTLIEATPVNVVVPEPVAVAPPQPAFEPIEVAAPPIIESVPQSIQPDPSVHHVDEAAPVADDELRAILDTATDGIITLDKTGKIHTFSAGAEAIFGYRIAEVADKPFIDLLEKDSRKTVRDYLAALQGPGLASVFNDGREVNAIVKQGGTVPLFLTIGALQSKSSTAAFCAVVRDITQWKRTEKELREAKETAEATSKQKSEFLARISHELRTPLNAIMGFSEVMRLERFGEIKNDRYRGYVNDIHSSGGLLLSLINDLLDLSKVEAGQLELNFTSVNLSDTADNAIKMLQEAATGARVVIRKAMPADLPNVVADQRSMRQIMLNVISNAIKFTDPGGQVIVSALTNQSGELKFRVKDTGIGMNEDQLRDALEPFKRVVTQGREVQGTGLGLPLTKALAEANRTSFNISSEPRKGTLIELTFPTTRVLAE
jgi:PAS domain S-box-containing protein